MLDNFPNFYRPTMAVSRIEQVLDKTERLLVADWPADLLPQLSALRIEHATFQNVILELQNEIKGLIILNETIMIL